MFTSNTKIVGKIVELLDPKTWAYLIMIQRDYANLNIPTKVNEYEPMMVCFSFTLSSLLYYLTLPV